MTNFLKNSGYACVLTLLSTIATAEATYAQQATSPTENSVVKIADVVKFGMGRPRISGGFRSNGNKYYDLVFSDESCNTLNKIESDSNKIIMFFGSLEKTTLTAGATIIYSSASRITQEIAYPFLTIAPGAQSATATCSAILAKSIPINTSIKLNITASGSTEFDFQQLTASILSVLQTTIDTITVFNPRFSDKIVSNKYKIDGRTYEELRSEATRRIQAFRNLTSLVAVHTNTRPISLNKTLGPQHSIIDFDFGYYGKASIIKKSRWSAIYPSNSEVQEVRFLNDSDWAKSLLPDNFETERGVSVDEFIRRYAGNDLDVLTTSQETARSIQACKNIASRLRAQGLADHDALILTYYSTYKFLGTYDKKPGCFDQVDVNKLAAIGLKEPATPGTFQLATTR